MNTRKQNRVGKRIGTGKDSLQRSLTMSRSTCSLNEAPAMNKSQNANLRVQEKTQDSTCMDRRACLARLASLAGGMGLAGSLSNYAWSSDQIPGAKQTKPIVIVNATLHPVASEVVTAAAIVLQDGKITALGQNIALPSDATRIDAAGSHVYPSLIDPMSNIGLTEIDSVRATVDSRETGNLNPNVRSAAAFNPDSELIPVARANGVLLAVSAPEGGIISGRSSLMMLDGWTWEDMTLKADVGMQVNWPRSGFGGFGGGGGGGPGGAMGAGGGSESELKQLEEILDQARRYHAAQQAGNAPKFDARLAALVPVLERKMPMVVTAFRATQIRSAVAFAKQHKLRLVIYGGYEALECSEVLLAEKIPVIVAGVYRLPARRDLPYDDAYSFPGRLKAAGVTFCIATAGRFGGSTLRNLPYHAATAAAFGLSREDALRSITLSTAEILGADDRVGSLAVGKDATLFIADGDILETPTQVTHAFIQGRTVDLNSRHTQLYKKYKAKLEQQQ